MRKCLYFSFPALLLAIVLLFCTALPPSKAFASSDVVSAYEQQNVMDDLEGMSIDGKQFDIGDYAFDESRSVQVLAMTEFCYSFYSEKQDDFGLYIYVWNPQGLQFDTASSLNSITLRAGDSQTEPFVKLPLVYLNRCEAQDLKGLFYKFRVGLSEEQKADVLKKVKSNERRYYLGEMELVPEGGTRADTYYVSKEFIFSGFAKGYGSNAEAESTLTWEMEQKEALSLEVKSTYYYPDGTHSDGVTRDVLQSVYFSVPNDILKQYGEMSAVHATWLNALTVPILVTGNREIYDALKPMLGVYVDGGTRQDYEENPLPYSIIATKAAEELRKDEETAPYGGHFAYNPYWGMRSGSDNYKGSYDHLVDTLRLLFLADNGEAKDHVITAEDLFDALNTYTQEHGGELVNGRYSRELFESVDGSFEDVTIEKDETYRLTDNIVSDTAWNRLFGTTVKGEHFLSVSALQAVTVDDFAGIDKAAFCDEFFIAEDDYTDLKSYVSRAEKENETVYLFRYKQSEYLSAQATEYERSHKWFLGSGNLGTYSYIDLNAYFAQMWVQLDFDVIDVTFSNGTSEVVIPSVTAPMDIAYDGKPPASWQDDDELEWWEIVLAIIALVLLVVMLAPFLPYVLKFILWLLMLPARFIVWFIGLFRKNE